AHIALSKTLVGAIGNFSLAGPGHKILVNDMRGNPPTCLRVFNRPVPGRYFFLFVRFLLGWHTTKQPQYTERFMIINRHTPFKLMAQIKAVGPQGHATDGPQRVIFCFAITDTLVDKAMLYF